MYLLHVACAKHKIVLYNIRFPTCSIQLLLLLKFQFDIHTLCSSLSLSLLPTFPLTLHPPFIRYHHFKVNEETLASLFVYSYTLPFCHFFFFQFTIKRTTEITILYIQRHQINSLIFIKFSLELYAN